MKSPMASRKKRMVSEPKTTWPATCNRSVPTNMTAVNKPHMAREAANTMSVVGVAHLNFAMMMNVTKEDQKNKYEIKAVTANMSPFHDYIKPNNVYANQ